jgi:hypothetical protein
MGGLQRQAKMGQVVSRSPFYSLPPSRFCFVSKSLRLLFWNPHLAVKVVMRMWNFTHLAPDLSSTLLRAL